MRKRAVSFLVVASAMAIACGSGESTTGGIPGSVGAGSDPGVASDRGNGSDPGTGSDTTKPSTGGIGGTAPTTCLNSNECVGGLCSETNGKRTGYCVRLCSLPPGVLLESGHGCPGGELCVALEKTGASGGCFRSCSTAADCPSLDGFVAECVTPYATSSTSLCIWGTVSDTPPPTPVPADAG